MRWVKGCIDNSKREEIKSLKKNEYGGKWKDTMKGK